MFLLKNTYTLIWILLATLLLTSCGPKEPEVPKLETSTVTDVDGNVYKTVKIGNQWWMAENLKTKSFRDGSPIKLSASNSAWIDTLPGYCIYDNNKNAPGFLYNWKAVNHSSKLAPLGWHIPSDQEWKELEKHLGMQQSEIDKSNWRGTTEGDQLKIEGTQGWTRTEGVWATDETGFSAIAGGCRLFDGTWGSPGLLAAGFWWSSSQRTGGNAWYRHLDYKTSKIFRYYGSQQYGFNIRCVKD